MHTKSVTMSRSCWVFIVLWQAVLAPVIQSLKQIDHVIKYNERWNQDGPLVILHDQVVPLKFPNLIRVGLDAVVSIARDRIRKYR